MLNHIVLMGRLVRDPELRRTQSGIAVASFRIAVDRDFGGRDGGEKQADFIDIVAWRGTAEFVSKYFAKGRMAVISGRLQMRDWTDKDGNKRTSAEVVADNVYFGESKRDGAPSGNTGYSGNPGYSGNAGYSEPKSYSGASGYGNYDAPAISTGFSEVEDDGELPF